MQYIYLHRVRKKCHSIFTSNIAKYSPIFKTRSPTDLAGNLLYSDKKIQPPFKCAATLSCEILMSEKKQQHETCTVINDI